MAQNSCPDFKVNLFFDLLGQMESDSSQLFNALEPAPGFLGLDRGPALFLCTLRDHDDAERAAAFFAKHDFPDHILNIILDFRNQDDMGAACNPGLKGNPPGI